MLDTMLKKLVSDGIVPGISYAIITPHRTKQHVIGMKQFFPEKVILEPDAVYDIASLTKVIATTTLILQQIESGNLQLSDKVQDFLPDFRYSEVTILHLLTHSSGLAKNIPAYTIESKEDVYQYCIATPQITPAGTDVTYADANFLLLGYIIEQLGDDIETQVTRNILMPLGLENTSYHPNSPHTCVPTEDHPNRGLITGIVHDFKAWQMDGIAGHAGLFSNLPDLIRYTKALLHDGAPILKEESIIRIAKNYTPNLNRSRGLGWDLVPSGDHFAIYHTGFTGTFMVIDLSKKTALIALTNRVHPSRDNTIFLERRDQIVAQFMQDLGGRT
ncbi:serine hydrolase domain-containing protein [Paenilisteria rocourtiae]|uniref:CubicO group peptidase (Beta-lactamase class C family) n=1 Tax=Listeria rocourtiae TaxID=647910 RepID=A0A4R6ZRK3_9LIST|nr:serine hydrolase domain-containing protein [Listeria rocourtiae]EUJ52384.1 beta-lactamase [Listeria rocourtiae FSL F6-920]MBC1603414.1 beta-lactamase family protein [Listeria rocourtiae]TDR55301.1 CubicO group peptidase (beta-lactamase class C family) [Listeria rocourtiae]